MLTKHYTLDHVFLPQVAPLREGAVICPILQVRKARNSRSTTRTQGVCPQHLCPNLQPACLDCISLAPNHWRRKALFQVSMTRESLIGSAGVTWPPLTLSLWLSEWNILIGWPELPTHFCDAEGRNGALWLTGLPKAPKEVDEKWCSHIHGLFPGQSDVSTLHVSILVYVSECGGRHAGEG